MSQHDDTPVTHAASGDHSISLEAYGFLDQSYDSVNSLLLDLTHSTTASTPAASTDHATVTVVGQPDGFASLSHLFSYI